MHATIPKIRYFDFWTKNFWHLFTLHFVSRIHALKYSM